MSNTLDLVIAVFDDEYEAGDIVDELHEIYSDGVIENSAIVIKDEEGEYSYEEFEDVNAKRGALFGAVVGGVIGLLGGPVGMVLGTAAGAATGGIAANRFDWGFDDGSLEELEDGLQPGSSALIALVKKEGAGELATELENMGAKVFRQKLMAEVARELVESEK
jgi:uncharacterized membrane protein